MKNINDYKGTKTAIHCKTQEEWDMISKLLDKSWDVNYFIDYKSESCIWANLSGFSSLEFAIQEEINILPASDFISTTRTIEQIETELEVLRNELAMLKEDARPEKKIEFVKHLDDLRISVGEIHPSQWDNVELIIKYGKYDIMKAWDNDARDDFAIYLGHYNDGIK